MRSFAVLTGDLLASSRLSPAQINAALLALRAGTGLISSWQEGLVTGFSRRGGDGWQMALSTPRHDLRAALVLQAYLRILGKGFSTRIAIARGDGHLPENGDTNAASGPVFTASGRLLDSLTGPHARMAHQAGGALSACTGLADHISQGWTPAQARALRLMLVPVPGTHAAAADQLGVSRQAVDQALTAAGYHALNEALHAYEQTGAAV